MFSGNVNNFFFLASSSNEILDNAVADKMCHSCYKFVPENFDTALTVCPGLFNSLLTAMAEDSSGKTSHRRCTRRNMRYFC
jgi:hypothetical protein